MDTRNERDKRRTSLMRGCPFPATADKYISAPPIKVPGVPGTGIADNTKSRTRTRIFGTAVN